jgi:hypothetical protein
MATASWSESWNNSAQQPEGFAAGLSMGMLEAKRWGVLRAIQLRFQGVVPTDLAASVRSIDDLDRLDTWYDAAITAPCVDTFRGMIGQFQCASRA